jgi:AraC-like DNA-binding protein
MMLSDKSFSVYSDWLTLKGANMTSHSGRTLLEHLIGTWRLMHNAGLRDALCLAGLFHSVYGTNAFRTITVSRQERAAVRQLIGTEAEVLAWIFGNIPRPRVLISALSTDGEIALTRQLKERFVDCVTPSTVRDLQAIECANLLEQGELWKAPRLAELAKEIGFLEASGFMK